MKRLSLLILAAALLPAPASADTATYVLQSYSQNIDGVLTPGTEILAVNSGTVSSFLSFQTSINFQSLTFDTQGNLYAVGKVGSSEYVYQFSSTGGVLSNTPAAILSLGVGIGSYQIDADAANNLYVLNGSSAVARFSPTGSGGAYELSGSLSLAGVNSPQSLAVDAAGDVFVGSIGGSGILEFAGFSSTPTTLSLSSALSLTATADGSALYFSDMSFGLHSVKDGTTAAFGATQGIPVGMDGSDNLYAVNPSLALERFDNVGGTLSTIPTEVAALGGNPISLAFTETQSVPEPSTWGLTLMGGLLLYCVRGFVRKPKGSG